MCATSLGQPKLLRLIYEMAILESELRKLATFITYIFASILIGKFTDKVFLMLLVIKI